MSHDAPNLDFEGSTPYEDYVKADVLTHLQHTLSDDPGEMVFLVTTQVMELWFTVIVHEWETAARALREDRIPVATDALKRSVRELEALNASWTPLGQLTPAQIQLLPVRPRRGLRLPVGDVPPYGVPARRQVRVHARPAPRRPARPRGTGEGAARAEPVRRGGPAAGPARVRHPRRPCSGATSPRSTRPRPRWRPPGRPSTPATRTASWPGSARPSTDVAELVWRWRNDHLVATRRAMGSKTGTGGSAGVAWLEKRARNNVFPELWTARSYV
ncbi:Tryptophan 2,3-dioxygenase OS=Streptomyces tendae OX=1932 GN=kynA PE=3 SV=1 [Streptomyces tendae]